jgi:hypothetical protein
MKQEMVRVGDPIIYRPNFDRALPVLVRVLELTITAEPHEKYGDDTQTKAPWSLVLEDRICFDMSNGYWCYSSQIDTDFPPSILKKIMRDKKENLPSHIGKHPALDVWITDQLRG